MGVAGSLSGQGATGSGFGQGAGSGFESGSGSGQGSAGSSGSSDDMSMLESSLSSQMFGGGPVSRQSNQECDRDAKYRTLDGSCNNLASPKQGASATAMPRLMDNAYSDGKFQCPITSANIIMDFMFLRINGRVFLRK